jgi:hypothetical protein
MIKEGWLTKCGGGHKSWKRRWFILQENLLYYFADKKVRIPDGTNFSTVFGRLDVYSHGA